jgi:sensor c-di-GMP phosphodiesterase-like protein
MMGSIFLMSNDTLLVVDDDFEICSIIKEVAENCGFKVGIAQDHASFHQAYAEEKPAVIILDLHLSDTDGIEIVHYLKNSSYDGYVLLISGLDTKLLASAEVIGKGEQLKMLPSLQKPIKISQLHNVLKVLLSTEPFVTKNSILEAIENDRFLVYYQPKISIPQKKVIGVEALIRWNYHGSVIVYPDSFIPLAEQTGVIAQLTEWIVNKVLSDQVVWMKQSINLSVAINVSAKLLENIQLSQLFISQTEELGVDPTQITLEITETGAMTLPEVALDIIARLRIRGFSISIDDFGTGYSSLISLHKMPFNELKIDKHFILTMEQDPNARKIVKSIIDLGHNLGVKIVAEGVETREVLKMLRSMGCDEAQGYLFSKAIPEKELWDWLKNVETSEWYKL